MSDQTGDPKEGGVGSLLAPPRDERIVKELARIANVLEKLERHFGRPARGPAYTERLDIKGRPTWIND